MTAYQFFSTEDVVHDVAGLQPAASGTVSFYDVGTATPRTTWSDYAQTTPNSNPMTLGPDGRLQAQVFMEGDYTVTFRDVLGAVIKTMAVYGAPAGVETIPDPALEAGKFLTNDGVNLVWEHIRQVPDPTGSTSHVLTTDGANILWSPFTAPDPEIAVTTTSFQAGVSTDETKFLVQMGSVTGAASGTNATTASVTFTTAFSTTPKVFVVPTSSSQPGGPVVLELTAVSTTGFTVRADVAEGSNLDQDIVNSVPIDWVAFGTKEVPA